MGIDGINEQHGALPVKSKTGTPQNANSRPEVQAPENADRVQFSDQSLEFIRIRQLADAAPELRQDRIQRLRQEIERGTYNVSGEDIADAIVRDGLVDPTAV
jgi:negative regulator of flagellin synthesis FlgM